MVASCGKFGERWAELCDAFGADTAADRLRVGREGGSRRALDEALAGSAAPAAGGIRHPVGDLDRRAQRHPGAERGGRRGHGSVLCVDAVSGLGAVDLPQDEWGVDVVVAGSQKSLMCPPGLAFASVSDRAMALAAERPQGRYYLDWQRTAAGQKEEPPNSAFTPAVTLFRALDVALDLLLRGGPGAGIRPPRAPRPGGARRGRRAWAGALRAGRRRTRTWSPSRAFPTTSTAPRCRS